MDNRYHRFLNASEYRPNVDFSQWETDGLHWVEFHKSLKLKQLGNPKIEPWLNSMGIKTCWIEVFYTPPGEDGVIHSDNTAWEDWAKIAFQYGAKGSTMRWWESNKVVDVSTSVEDVSLDIIEDFSEGEDKRILNSVGDRTEDHYHGNVLIAKPEDSKIVYEIEVGESSLVNSGPLHSSHNPTNDKRFAITIALFDENYNRLMWDDALDRMKDYIS